MSREKQPKIQEDGGQVQDERKFKSFVRHRKTQIATSIYFVLWAIFTAITLMIVLLSAISHHWVFMNSYKEQAEYTLAQKGVQIEIALTEGFPMGNKNGLLRTLERQNGVSIYVLDENGRVILPQEDGESMENAMSFSEQMPTILAHLEAQKGKYALYEGTGEYLFVSDISLFPQRTTYLYVRQSLELLEEATERMNLRVLLISIFVFVLSLAITSAVSGWFTNPISEMTKKARQLAQGDFDVDFGGDNYGTEMVALADALNFARDELSKTDRMQKELIANVSHDFKTPLTMIKAYASMIIEISGEIPEKRNKHAQVIVDEADRLASLVNDVLDLSKISSGIEELKKTEFDMSSYVYEILDRFAYLREARGYRFITDIDDELYTFADEGKIGQVLYNLIGNAVNYTGENNTVYVSLKKESDRVFRFSVTDTGKGIKAEELPEIWDRYYRSTDSHKRPVNGTGLGLSIVKTILERHNFLFGVESEVGHGSTFYVLFPLVEEGSDA